VSPGHKDALKLLFPVTLGGVFEDDITLEGAALDAVQERAVDLLNEGRPDIADELLADWERVWGLTPEAEDSLAWRQLKLLAKIRLGGGLNKEYFSNLAAALGYTVTILEDIPFMAGWGRSGDRVYIAETLTQFIWHVVVTGEPAYGSRTALEAMVQDLKPAHTLVYFVYPEA
jgi:uncharacterized protein YmfQ (DUF2313 family)